MKLDALDFGKALSKISHAVPAKATLSILESVKLVAAKGTLTATGGNLEKTVAVTVAASGAFSACVPFARLKELVTTLKGEIEITADAKTKRCTVTWGKNKYSLTCDGIEEYPAGDAGTGEAFTLDAESMLEMFAHVRFAVSSSETSPPAMQGVLVDLQASSAIAGSIHRLSWWNDCKGDIVLPAVAVDVLLKVFKEGELTITKGDKYLTVTDGANTLSTRLVEDPYPNAASVVPELSKNMATIDRALLLENTRRVMLFSNSLTRQVRLNFTPLVLTVTSEDIEKSGDARDEMAIVYEGTEMLIGVNGQYLVEALAHIESKWVDFYLTTPAQAMLIKAGNKSEPVTCLVMPVRVGNN